LGSSKNLCASVGYGPRLPASPPPRGEFDAFFDPRRAPRNRGSVMSQSPSLSGARRRTRSSSAPLSGTSAMRAG
jgi:hypothetical protein